MNSVNMDMKTPSNNSDGATKLENTQVIPRLDSNFSDDATPAHFHKDSRFWLILLALCVSCFLSALDLTAVSTILPTCECLSVSLVESWFRFLIQYNSQCRKISIPRITPGSDLRMLSRLRPSFHGMFYSPGIGRKFSNLVT